MLKGPCKDCPDRTPGCHGKCEKYLDYRARLDAMKEEERKRKRLEYDLYMSSRHAKTYEKRRRRPYADNRGGR